MMRQILKNQAQTFNKSVYCAGGKQRPKTPNDLETYNVISVGSHLASVANRQLILRYPDIWNTHMFVANEPKLQLYCKRIYYEQDKVDKRFFTFASLKLCDFSQSIIDQTVVEYKPNENAIVFKNGRTVKYDQLIIGTGLVKDYDYIEGLVPAVLDQQSQVFAAIDHHDQRPNDEKQKTNSYNNFFNGTYYYCIPKRPFSGEVENYNFFLTDDVFQWQKKIASQTPLQKICIVNANDTFVEHQPEADEFIKKELAKREIEVIYGKELIKVDSDSRKATLRDVKTGGTEVKEFSRVYTHCPGKVDPLLAKSGLAASNGLLDVNNETLQHNKFKNIFGIGDCANLPTTKTFEGGLEQVNVIRHNLYALRDGKDLVAKYDGYAKAPLILGNNHQTFLEHTYGGKPGKLNIHKSAKDFGSNRAYSDCSSGGTINKILDAIQNGKKFPPHYHWAKKYGGESPLDDFIPGPVKKLFASKAKEAEPKKEANTLQDKVAKLTEDAQKQPVA